MSVEVSSDVTSLCSRLTAFRRESTKSVRPASLQHQLRKTSTRRLALGARIACALDNTMNQHEKHQQLTSVVPLSPSPSMDDFLRLAHKLADTAGDILLKYFRKSFDIVDKDDASPVTIADKEAEQAMRSLVSDHFPDHAIFGEEWGLYLPEAEPDYVWVLDPIDGTKSFITGKPVFGTLICLVHRGVPIVGILDQPVLKERWVGAENRKTVLNLLEVTARPCNLLANAYMYTTSPHLFSGSAKKSYDCLSMQVKAPLYGCDCYAYGLLAAGQVDLVVESGLKPYDFLALVPIVKGAGGVITNWEGQELGWWPCDDSMLAGTDVAAAGDLRVHRAALETLKRGNE